MFGTGDELRECHNSDCVRDIDVCSLVVQQGGARYISGRVH
jgi:hypothetical protein